MTDYQVVENLQYLLDEYYKFADLCKTLCCNFRLINNIDYRHVILDQHRKLYHASFTSDHLALAKQDKQLLIEAMTEYVNNVTGTLTSCFKDESRNYIIEDFNLSNIEFSSVKIFDGFICEGKSELIFTQTASNKEFEGSFYFRKRLLPNRHGWVNLPVEYYKIYILYDILCSLQFYHARGKIFYLYRYLSHPCFEYLPCSFGCAKFDDCCNEHRLVPSARHEQVSIDFLNLLICTFVTKKFDIEFFLFYNEALLEPKEYKFKSYRTMEKTTYSVTNFYKIASAFYTKLFNFYFGFFWNALCFVPETYTIIKVNTNLFFLVKSGSKDYYNDYNISFKYWQRRFIRTYYENNMGSGGDNFVLYFCNLNYYLNQYETIDDFLFQFPNDHSDFCLSFINLQKPTAQIYESLKEDMHILEYQYTQSNTIELEIEELVPRYSMGKTYAFTIWTKQQPAVLIPAKGMKVFSLRTSHSRLNFLYLNLSCLKDGLLVKHENNLIYVINQSLLPRIFNPTCAFNFFTNSIKSHEDFDKYS